MVFPEVPVVSFTNSREKSLVFFNHTTFSHYANSENLQNQATIYWLWNSNGVAWQIAPICSIDVKVSMTDTWKNIFVLSSYEFLSMLEGKIWKCPFSRVQSDEITVCSPLPVLLYFWPQAWPYLGWPWSFLHFDHSIKF